MGEAPAVPGEPPEFLEPGTNPATFDFLQALLTHFVVMPVTVPASVDGRNVCGATMSRLRTPTELTIRSAITNAFARSGRGGRGRDVVGAVRAARHPGPWTIGDRA